MNSSNNHSDRTLLYDPMFDRELRKTMQRRQSNKLKRFLFITFIVVSVVVSISLSFYSLERDRYNYRETENGIMLSQFSGREDDRILYVDYLRNNDGKMPDVSKPVTQVREFAVNCNEYLRYIYISKTVNKIESTSFFTVNNLYGIFVEEGNPHYAVIDGVLYELENGEPVKAVISPAKRGYALTAESVGAVRPQSVDDVDAFLRYCEENKEKIDAAYENFRYTVDLPDTVKTVGQLCFAYNEKLREVVLHEGITELEEMSMFRCWQTEKIDFPSTLKVIGSDAMSYCGEIKYIFIPESVTSIGHHAFYSSGAEQIHMELSEEDVKNKVELGDGWAPEKRDVFMKRVPILYNEEKEVM